MLRDNLRLARPFLVLLLVFTVARWTMGVRGVDYSKGHFVFSLVTLTLMACIFYAAFTRRWLGFAIMRAFGLGLTLAFCAQAMIVLATGLSYALGTDTYFTHPTALNTEGPIPAGDAMARRVGGLVVNTLFGGIAAALGWVFGGALPNAPAPRRDAAGAPATRAVLAAACLCLAGSAAAGDLAAERAALLRLDKEWAKAAAARDVEKTVSFWADDARVFPPGQPVVAGKAALRRYVTESFALPGFSISWETTDVVVAASGDLAYGVGTNKVALDGPQGPIAERGRAVTVWRKGADGWKCVIDIWNAEPPPTPPAK